MPDVAVAFPEREAISDLFSVLFDRPVQARRGSPKGFTGRAATAQAIYVFDDGQVAAVAICDLGLTSPAGAALSLMSPRMASECVDTGMVSGVIQENLREVMNIASNWFNGSYFPHVRLREVQFSPEPLADDAMDMLFTSRRRLDAAVEIAGYPRGAITLLAAH